MKKLTAIALLSLSLLTAACNTMEGLGEDVQHGGSHIEDAANDNK
jgi:predicted small secreted protein